MKLHFGPSWVPVSNLTAHTAKSPVVYDDHLGSCSADSMRHAGFESAPS